MFVVQTAVGYSRIPARPSPEAARIYKAIEQNPKSRWRRLVAKFYETPDHKLAPHDIAEMSLACSEGLPNSQNRQRLQETLDEWTREVGEQTARWRGEFAKAPGKFGNSMNRYRMVVMKTVFSHGFRVAANPAGREYHDCRDCRLLFLDGPLTGFDGICGTLALLCVAIGRRLGYPLRLAMSYDHVLARWEGPDGERFNVECTTPGFVSKSDEFYQTWGHPVSVVDVAFRRTMASLTPREELSFLLDLRAWCLCYNLRLDEAEEALFHANGLAPHDDGKLARWHAVRMMQEMIQIAAERGNRDGPLSPAVEHVPYPEPADSRVASLVPVVRERIARLRRYYLTASKTPAQQFGVYSQTTTLGPIDGE